MQMKKTDPLIIVEQTYNAPIEKVWNALTRKDQMNKWYFQQIETFNAEPGFETQFTLEHEGRAFTHIWKVTEVKFLEKIKTNWRFGEYEGDSFVTFELKPLNEGTALKVIVEVTADFPDGIKEFTRESCSGGWKYFNEESLLDYLSSV